MNNLCPTVDNFLKIVDAFQSNYLNFSNNCVTHTHTHTHTHRLPYTLYKCACAIYSFSTNYFPTPTFLGNIFTVLTGIFLSFTLLPSVVAQSRAAVYFYDERAFDIELRVKS